MENVSKNFFGMECILDLGNCNREKISSKDVITSYATDLCKVIDMKPFGEPFAERFALDNEKAAGYSLVQLIETSSITGHFSEYWLKAYINIFSCKEFDADTATKFTQNYFGAGDISRTVLIR